MNDWRKKLIFLGVNEEEIKLIKNLLNDRIFEFERMILFDRPKDEDIAKFFENEIKKSKILLGKVNVFVKV